jgi:type II secretion system protein G
MLTRIRKARENEGGFTLIELLVVMIIIGILAAIAIPVFLSQRAKAVDTAAKSDISTLGKEVATYWVDGTTNPTVAEASGRYLVNGADVGKQSNKMGAVKYTGTNDTDWCVSIAFTGGTTDPDNLAYTAKDGLVLHKAC